MKWFPAHHRPLSRSAKLAVRWCAYQFEDLLQELAGATEQTLVVTAVPDEKKGNASSSAHAGRAHLEECLRTGKSDLPALLAATKDILRIETLPIRHRKARPAQKRADGAGDDATHAYE